MQADSLGLVYLFFYDRHGYHGLSKEEALAMHSHIADAFVEWIGRSACFDVVPLPLEGGWQRTMVAQEKQGNVFDLWKNLFYLCKRMNLQVLDCHNWWVEHPQFQKPKRE